MKPRDGSEAEKHQQRPQQALSHSTGSGTQQSQVPTSSSTSTSALPHSSSSVTPARPHRTSPDHKPRVGEVLYLFAGPAHADDITNIKDLDGMGIKIHCIDIERDQYGHDLLNNEIWEVILKDVRSGRYMGGYIFTAVFYILGGAWRWRYGSATA